MATESSNVKRRKRNSTDDSEEEYSIKPSRTESRRKIPRRVYSGRTSSNLPRMSLRRRPRPVPSSETIPMPVDVGQSSRQLPSPSITQPELSVSISVIPNRLDSLFELGNEEESPESGYSTPNVDSRSDPIQLTTPSLRSDPIQLTTPSSSSRPIVLDDLFMINSPDDNRDSESQQQVATDLGGQSSSQISDNEDNEVIVVESDDDENDEDVVVTHQTTLSQDELLARRLQTQLDQESTTNLETFGTSVHSRSMTPYQPSGMDMIRDNLDALATRVDNWTVADARRFLMVTLPPGRRGNQRMVERHLTRTNPMLLYAAIMGGSSAVPVGVSSMGSYEDLLELAEQLGPAQPSGFSDEAIKSIKRKKFKPGCSSSSEDSKQSCVICMSDFESNELQKTLNPCKHDFHSKCIDPWLKTHKTCPICRSEVQIRKN